MRHVVGREIVVNLVDRGSNDLIAARPLLETVVDAGLQTDVFRRVFREAAIQTNRVLFVREKSNVAFDLADASEVVRYGLRSVDPKLAKQVPRNVDVALLQLKRRQFATGTLEVADRVRVLGLVLPALALVTLLGAVAVAPDRRLGVLRAGVAVGAAGAHAGDRPADPALADPRRRGRRGRGDRRGGARCGERASSTRSRAT